MKLPLLPTVETPAKNAVRVNIGPVSIYWSYSACIAFTDSRLGNGTAAGLFNPEWRKFSKATTGHANVMAVGQLPDAPSPEAFGAALAAALGAPAPGLDDLDDAAARRTVNNRPWGA